MYLLGVDFGGGASKATLLKDDGTIAATNSVEYKTHYPRADMAEQTPYDWYEATAKNISALIEKSGVAPEEIAGVCLDAATHTAVICDDDFNVLRDSIYWTDSRSVKECAYLRENYADMISAQALHSPDTIWTLPQLMWIKENEPQIWKKVGKIMFAKDYVRYLLTGVYCTDFIEAEGSMMFDFGKMDWSDELCGILGFDKAKMPPVKSPTDIIGSITETAAKQTGLKVGTPVVCGTTDTVMEVYASGAVNAGDMTVKLATAGRVCVITDKPYPNRDLVNYSHVASGLWYPGTATKAAASSLRWYRDTFGGSYRELDDAAANIAPGCEGLMYHPYINGELTPYADPKLHGSFIGIRAAHTKAHFNRAVLEGVAFSLLDSLNKIDEIGIPHSDTATIIGGGSSSPLWRQIVADMLGITLRQAENSDSSFGSAMLCGVALGVFDDLQSALDKCVKYISVTEPNKQNTEYYRSIYPRYRAVHDALAPIYHEM